MPQRGRFPSVTSSVTWSGTVPVVVALLLGALMLPRGVLPDDVPLPAVDGRALSAVEVTDDRRVERVLREPLSPEVRELGSAVREFNEREARGVPRSEASQVRRKLEALVPHLVDPPEPLLALRAVQMEQFLVEVHRYERTGTATPELAALGGSFLARMQQVGWAQGQKVLLDDTELRVAFKLAWNGVVGVDARPDFAVTLDENRALYTFYLKNPHPSEQATTLFDSALRAARDEKSCEALRAGRDLAAERWRLDKIEHLGAIDPSYPLVYARGVGQLRAGRYQEAARSFEAYLAAHPDGPFALRAKNYLKAALDLSV